MSSFAVREAKLRQAIATAKTLSEQRRLVAQLDDVRRQASAQKARDNELDLAASIVRDTLTPVKVHDRHTASSDWLSEVEVPAGGDYGSLMRVEASLWFKKLHNEVKADRHEFAEQAMGMAHRLAGQFGEMAPRAQQAFLDEAGRLHRLSAGDSPGKVDEDQSGNAESQVTDYDTKTDQDPMWAEDWDGEDDTGSQIGSGIPSVQPGADGSDVDSEAFDNFVSRKRASEGQTCSVCGDAIAKDGDSYHHDNGEKHDHEAKPGSKESRRRVAEFGGPGGQGQYQVGDLVVLTNGSVGIYDGEVSQVASYVVADGDRLVVPNTVIDRKYDGSSQAPSFVSSKTANFTHEERRWYAEGYDRGAGDRADFADAEGINPDDYSLTSDDYAGNPLSGELAGQSIPEIFGSWENATDEAMDAYEEGYEDGFQGNPRQAKKVVRPKGRKAAEFNERGVDLDEYCGECEAPLPNHYNSCSQKGANPVDQFFAQKKTAGVYCNTHDVWVGDGNEDTHQGCSKEQKATEKTKDARRKKAWREGDWDIRISSGIEIYEKQTLPPGIESATVTYEPGRGIADWGFQEATSEPFPAGYQSGYVRGGAAEGKAYLEGLLAKTSKLKKRAEDEESDDEDSDDATNAFAEEVAEELSEESTDNADEGETDEVDSEDDSDEETEKEAKLRQFRAKVQANMKKMSEYQGYSNWETWNVSLAVENEYDIYMATEGVTSGFEMGNIVTPMLRALPHWQSTIEGMDWSLVNWTEVAEVRNDE